MKDNTATHDKRTACESKDSQTTASNALTVGGAAITSTETSRAYARLNSFQRDALGAIYAIDAPCGLDIKRELADYYGNEVYNGRLYPNLDELVERGLIEKRVQVRDDRSNEYELTETGRAALFSRRHWLGPQTFHKPVGAEAEADGGEADD